MEFRHLKRDPGRIVTVANPFEAMVWQSMSCPARRPCQNQPSDRRASHYSLLTPGRRAQRSSARATIQRMAEFIMPTAARLNAPDVEVARYRAGTASLLAQSILMTGELERRLGADGESWEPQLHPTLMPIPLFLCERGAHCCYARRGSTRTRFYAPMRPATCIRSLCRCGPSWSAPAKSCSSAIIILSRRVWQPVEDARWGPWRIASARTTTER